MGRKAEPGEEEAKARTATPSVVTFHRHRRGPRRQGSSSRSLSSFAGLVI